MYDTIIVMGCDKTGKSTLINNLLSVPDIKTRFSVYKGNKMSSTKAAFDASMEVLNEHHNRSLLCDRFHFPDDMVYHPIFNTAPFPDDITQNYMERVLPILYKQRNTLIVYCYGNEDEVAERFKQEGEDLVSVDNIRDIMNNYIDWLKLLYEYFPIVVLNSSYESKSDMFNKTMNAFYGNPVLGGHYK